MSYVSVSQNDSQEPAASASTPGSEFISLGPSASEVYQILNYE